VTAVKLVLAAVEPVSYDMFSIVSLVNDKRPLIGPWIALYPPIYVGMLNSIQAIQQWYLASPVSTNSNLELVSLLFRLPILVFDLATAIVLYFLGKKMGTRDTGMLASLVWFLNPFTLFSVELLGVPDVVATFLVTLSFGLLVSRRVLLSGVLLALGTWLKLYPVFLLPPLLLIAQRHGISRRYKAAFCLLGLVGLFGYLSWIYPFDLLYLVQYTPVTQPLPFMHGTSVVDASAFGLIAFYCLLAMFARKRVTSGVMLISTLLVYYLVSDPYPQYLIWAMPFMALDLAVSKDRFRAVLFAIFYALAFTQWFFASSAFLTPSRFSLLMIPFQGNLPWYSQLIANILDWSRIRLIAVLLLPLISSAFYACAFMYVVDVSRSWFASYPKHHVVRSPE
jgi:hypothetical protein